jgi:hypothetical protein
MRQSGAVPILLLNLSATTTSAYSSLGVLQGLKPRHQLLKASVYHSAASVGGTSIISGDQRAFDMSGGIGGWTTRLINCTKQENS